MEEQVTQELTQETSTPDQASPDVSTPSTTTDTTPEAAVASTPGTEATPEIPAFSPNWKFKVTDKEHEIPEWARAGVKDAALEKQAREVFEKAYGLDIVKPKYQETRQKYQELNQQHTDLMSNIDMARQHVAKGDYEAFFQQLNLPEEQVLKYFIEKAKMLEAPPEQRQAYQQKVDAERRAHQAESRVAQVERERAEQLKADTLTGLQGQFAKPEVDGFAKQFDTRLGKEGAFFDEVVRRGNFYWKSGAGYVPPEKVVQEVMQLAGYTPGAAATAPAAQPGQTQAAPNSQVVNQVASIPAISGRSAAPMSRKPNSVEDLVETYKKKFGSGS